MPTPMKPAWAALLLAVGLSTAACSGPYEQSLEAKYVISAMQAEDAKLEGKPLRAPYQFIEEAADGGPAMVVFPLEKARYPRIIVIADAETADEVLIYPAGVEDALVIDQAVFNEIVAKGLVSDASRSILATHVQ